VDAIGPPSDFVDIDLLPLREPEVGESEALSRQAGVCLGKAHDQPAIFQSCRKLASEGGGKPARYPATGYPATAFLNRSEVTIELKNQVTGPSRAHRRLKH